MIVLTGGAGFIGSAFLAKLNEMGRSDVLVVDHLGKSDKWKNLSNKSYADYLNKGDFLERLLCGDDFGDIDAVVHLGACSSTTERDADYIMENNYRYSRIVLEWALSEGARVIYASSAATYGDGKQGFDDAEEGIARLQPLNVYGYSKQAVDQWALRTGLAKKVVGLKFFNVFGPNEYHKGDQSSVILKAFHQISATGKVQLFKSLRPEYRDGEQLRDFVYVKDCCDVIWKLLDMPAVNGIFNLGTGKARSWNDLVSAVFRAMGREPVIEYIDLPEVLRGKYQYFTEAKMAKLAAAGCPLHPRSLEDSVKDYVQNYLMKDQAIL